jgi:hypothetical protein
VLRSLMAIRLQRPRSELTAELKQLGFSDMELFSLTLNTYDADSLVVRVLMSAESPYAQWSILLEWLTLGKYLDPTLEITRNFMPHIMRSSPAIGEPLALRDPSPLRPSPSDPIVRGPVEEVSPNMDLAHHFSQTQWCWTHGSGHHASSQCNRPALGHRYDATVTDTHGGASIGPPPRVSHVRRGQTLRHTTGYLLHGFDCGEAESGVMAMVGPDGPL